MVVSNIYLKFANISCLTDSLIAVTVVVVLKTLETEKQMLKKRLYARQ